MRLTHPKTRMKRARTHSVMSITSQKKLAERQMSKHLQVEKANGSRLLWGFVEHRQHKCLYS